MDTSKGGSQIHNSWWKHCPLCSSKERSEKCHYWIKLTTWSSNISAALEARLPEEIASWIRSWMFWCLVLWMERSKLKSNGLPRVPKYINLEVKCRFVNFIVQRTKRFLLFLLQQKTSKRCRRKIEFFFHALVFENEEQTSETKCRAMFSIKLKTTCTN